MTTEWNGEEYRTVSKRMVTNLMKVNHLISAGKLDEEWRDFLYGVLDYAEEALTNLMNLDAVVAMAAGEQDNETMNRLFKQATKNLEKRELGVASRMWN